MRPEKPAPIQTTRSLRGVNAKRLASTLNRFDAAASAAADKSLDILVQCISLERRQSWKKAHDIIKQTSLSQPRPWSRTALYPMKEAGSLTKYEAHFSLSTCTALRKYVVWAFRCISVESDMVKLAAQRPSRELIRGSNSHRPAVSAS